MVKIPGPNLFFFYHLNSSNTDTPWSASDESETSRGFYIHGHQYHHHWQHQGHLCQHMFSLSPHHQIAEPLSFHWCHCGLLHHGWSVWWLNQTLSHAQINIHRGRSHIFNSLYFIFRRNYTFPPKSITPITLHPLNYQNTRSTPKFQKYITLKPLPYVLLLTLIEFSIGRPIYLQPYVL